MAALIKSVGSTRASAAAAIAPEAIARAFAPHGVMPKNSRMARWCRYNVRRSSRLNAINNDNLRRRSTCKCLSSPLRVHPPVRKKEKTSVRFSVSSEWPSAPKPDWTLKSLTLGSPEPKLFVRVSVLNPEVQ